MQYDVLIVGAGAAGLMASKELSKAGYSVCMLEAASHAGGRIITVHEDGFSEPAEAGPEFIHGNLDLTFQLLKEASLTATETAGDMITVQNGQWNNAEETDTDWPLFMQRLQQSDTEMTIEDLLQTYFHGDRYAALRNAVKHYAEGFDLADISKASSLFIKVEWTQQQEPNYRIKGGYGKLVAYLENKCREQGVTAYYDQVVFKIEHNKALVTVHTTNGSTFMASKIIITVPLGVLQSHMIIFEPALVEHATAIQQLGFGAVIKILLQFNSNFWTDYADDIGFILSDETIPTWWTQLPASINLLTGWVGGPPAAGLSKLSNDALLQIALHSLSSIFNVPANDLHNRLVHHKIICWRNMPFVKGGYSYPTTRSVEAKSILAVPVNNNVFFAGEALYNGKSQGTVEAALQSGRQVAALLIKKT